MNGPVIYYPIKEMYGTDLSSTKLSFELYNSIIEDLDLGMKIEIDFKNVRSVSCGWLRNCIGLIVKNKGEKFFRDNIRIINMNKNIKLNLAEVV